MDDRVPDEAVERRAAGGRMPRGQQRPRTPEADQGRAMTKRIVCVTACMLLAIASRSVDAHHSFAAEYDANKPVTIKGTVASMKWSNPHAWLYLDVKEADGTVSH